MNRFSSSFLGSDYKIEPEEKDPLARAKEADGLEGLFLIIDDEFRAFSDYRPGYGLVEYLGKSGTVVIPDVITRIEDKAFKGNCHIRHVTIPASVHTIGYDVFTNCPNLEEVYLPDSIDRIPDFSGSGLKAITLPSTITKIEDYTFSDCNNLEEIEIPNGVLEIGSHAFDSCFKLKEVLLPDTVTLIDEGAFYFCTALEKINIPKSVTTINEDAFFGCEKLPAETCALIRALNPDALF